MSADDIDDELFALAGGDEDADVEEGEASSVAASSPNSLGSGAMEESDSDRDDDEVPSKDSNVPYPLEGKYIDLKDKARIMGMSQLERETIIGNREEELNKLRFQAELARRAATMQNDKKRKAPSDEADESQRKSSRQKAKPKNSLEAYKRDREQRGQQQHRQDDQRSGRRRSSSSARSRRSRSRRGHSDLDADGESEVEYDERAKQAAREEQPAALVHFESVRVSRAFFSQVCFYPGFEEAMAGSYARIGVGQDSQKRTLYKMAQIKGFASSKPYVFEGKNGQRIATDLYVIAQHGSVKKEYQFQFLSNQRFSETELDLYKRSLAETSAKMPTQAFLKKKYEDIKMLENRFWTDADINARIAKSTKFAHLLESRRDQPTVIVASKSEINAQRLADINRLNRKLEAERVRKALLEERHQQQRGRKQREREMLRKKAEEEAKKVAEEEKASKKLEALFDGDGSSRASTPKPQEKKKVERKGLPTFRRPTMDDDIIASMDIGVEIDI
ncbi:hypothetical protein BDV95DRAFT_566188 [Massariosphaeria phaeospora]|uniref:Plus3 domain-containing protein n=1 Tax=Massariosphaeria phaeospora TaxID=100035 RepID=A0A7C8M9E6_9PLEO|nr:hypothetical protein BDV95DRAFT_566188 [Massariosphaeria phaeospora]